MSSFLGNFMEHFLLQLWLAQIHRVIAVNFEFIFEEFHGTFLILTVVGLNLSQCWIQTEVVKH